MMSDHPTLGAERFQPLREQALHQIEHRQLDATARMLRRLAEKVRRADAIRHSGGRLTASDWSELHGLQQEAFALLATLER